MERIETLGMIEFGVPVHGAHDPSDDLVAFLIVEGVVGAVNVLAGDSSTEVFGVLFADESGVPARWFPDGAAVGFGRGELDDFRMRLRERFGRTAWVGEPDATAGDEPGSPANGWGIRSLAWYTESQQFGAPELVARALGGSVTWAPLGRGLLFVPHDPQAFVLSGYWQRGRSVLMWATRSRRAFAASGWRVRGLAGAFVPPDRPWSRTTSTGCRLSTRPPRDDAPLRRAHRRPRRFPRAPCRR